MRVGSAAKAVVIGLALMLSGCSTGPYPVRYRLTLEVLTDGVVHSGSSVIAVDYGTASSFPNPGTMAYAWIQGQAVLVDLGSRGVLACLLGGPTESNRNSFGGLPLWVFRSQLPRTDWEAKARAASKLKGSADVPPDQLPMLVLFPDRTNPATIQIVDPQHPEATLGPGAKIVRAHIEITDAPVTTGIDNVLPWLGPGKKRFSMPLDVFGMKNYDWAHPERNLTDYDFRKGVE